MSVLVASIIFIAGFVSAWALVFAIRLLARRVNLVDLPNPRSIHSRPTPRGGGIAIVIVCFVGIGVAAVLGVQLDSRPMLGYILGASVVVVVSLVDDFRALPAGIRLAAQLVAAAALVLGLTTHSGLLVSLSSQAPGWLVMGLAVLWTVGLTNAFNFMDGIDGLAAMTGFFAGLTWSLIASLTGQPWLAVLALLVSAGCAAFLLFNWSPASIFMGDVGSAFLGFTFAFIALACPLNPNQFFFGVFVFWPFIFDASFTILGRLRRRENILVAHRAHLYQRLVLSGLSQARVATLYGLFALATFSVGVMGWLAQYIVLRYLAIAIALLLSVSLWRLVVSRERLPR
jgi:UDP-N-acetylmuramyl pentapeptide phosphotransferase/UDP-N-acetylglucosamine-1-phosphate transferase